MPDHHAPHQSATPPRRPAARLGSAALVGLAAAGAFWLASRHAADHLDDHVEHGLDAGIAVLRLAGATGRFATAIPPLEGAGSGPARADALDVLRPLSRTMAALADDATRAGLDHETAAALRQSLSGLLANLDDLARAMEARIAVDAELHSALMGIPERHAALRDALSSLPEEALAAGPEAAEILHVGDAIGDRARRMAERLLMTPLSDQAAFRTDARALEALLDRLPLSTASAGRFEAARQLMAPGLDTGNVFELRQERQRLADIAAALARDSLNKADAVSLEATQAADRLREAAVVTDAEGAMLLRTAPLIGGLAAALAALVAGTLGPAAPQPVPAAPALVAPVAEEPPGLRILLAEDERMTQAVSAALLRRAGHAVTVADDGRAALRALDEQPFDLALLDLRMPEMDGLEALRHIRALPDPETAGLPVVVLTASPLAEDTERCRAAGADAVLPKPLRLDALLPVLERIGSGLDGPLRDPARSNSPSGPSTTRPADKVPAFDHAALDQMLDALPAERVAMLIGATIKALGEYRQALLQAWAAGDGAAVGAVAHKIAGVAGVYGCPALHATARSLERAIRTTGDAPAPLIDALDVAYPSALEALERQRDLLSPPVA